MKSDLLETIYEDFINKVTDIIDGYICGDIIGMQPHIKTMFSDSDKLIPLSKEEFIEKIKINKKFAKHCGVEINERNLNLFERHKLALPIWKEKYGILADMMVETNVDNTPYKIPIKLITITYNNKTEEIYEHGRVRTTNDKLPKGKRIST